MNISIHFKFFNALVFCCAGLVTLSAMAREVISVDLQRTHEGQPVVISALLQLSPQPNGRALLIFPGWPGIPRIETKEGVPSFYYLQEHFEKMRPALHAAGISTVTMDCPTDQWGARGPNPGACDDRYRSSEQHAKDVAAMIRQLRSSKNLEQVVIMGHSYGAISSHWLSVHLGKEDIQAVIHSATQSVAGGGAYTQYGSSMNRFQHTESKVPYFYLHHKNDLCRSTPYSYAEKHAPQGQLMTVIGGNRWAEACGKASYHSYSERTDQLAQALVLFMNKGEVTLTIKGQED
jgi:hypothetical protein